MTPDGAPVLPVRDLPPAGGVTPGADHRFLRGLQAWPRPIARIAGIGVELGPHSVGNDEIGERLEADAKLKELVPALLYRTTLIQRRRHAEAHERPSDYAARAARKALAHAGVEAGDIDTLIFAATDRDVIEPATANIVQHKLGLEIVNSFDVQNACNSFLQALSVANSLLATGAARRVLVCSGELGSQWSSYRIEDKEELRLKLGGLTLGDAGAAVVVEPSDGESGFQEINLLSLGEHWELCHLPDDVAWRQNGGVKGWFYLDMAELARVVRRRTAEYFLAYTDYRREQHGERTPSEGLDWVVPHQISRRLIEEVAEALHVEPELLAVTADEYGNTGATAIPVTLARLLETGKISFGSGQELLLFGAASGLGLGHIRLRM